MAVPIVTDFSNPATMDEAEDLYAELNDACTLIQAQLSQKNHMDEDGNRLPDIEYHQWRSRATWALAQKRIQMRAVKRWIIARNKEATRLEAGVKNPANVVELFATLLRVAKRNIDFEDIDPQDAAVLRLAERWIRDRGAPAVVAAREKMEAGS